MTSGPRPAASAAPRIQEMPVPAQSTAGWPQSPLRTSFDQAASAALRCVRSPASEDSSPEHRVEPQDPGCRPEAKPHGYPLRDHSSDFADYGRERSWCGAMRVNPPAFAQPTAKGIREAARARLSLASELPPTMRPQKRCEGKAFRC